MAAGDQLVPPEDRPDCLTWEVRCRRAEEGSHRRLGGRRAGGDQADQCNLEVGRAAVDPPGDIQA